MGKKTAFILFFIVVITILAAFSLYEKEFKKPAGDKLVIAFGDSLTYGFGDEKGKGYIDSLEKKLNEKRNQEFQFQNEAIYGLESSGILSQLSDIRVTRKLDEADYFIVFIGTNDLINSNGGNLAKLDRDAIEGGQAVFLQNLEAILQTLEQSGDNTPILLLGLYNPYPDSQRIEAIIDDWNREMIQLAKADKQIVYIPTNDLFKGKGKKQYFSDSLHLNDKGYNLVAKRVLDKYTFE